MPAEQARKTELMKEVNQAYKAGNLLRPLELQLRIERIDQATLAGLAEERRRHYVHVLEEQSRRLSEELAEVVQPFAMSFGGAVPRNFRPEVVKRALELEIRELKGIVRNVETDLLRFQDVRQLKESLTQYRIEPPYVDWAMLDELRPSPPRRRRP